MVPLFKGGAEGGGFLWISFIEWVLFSDMSEKLSKSSELQPPPYKEDIFNFTQFKAHRNKSTLAPKLINFPTLVFVIISFQLSIINYQFPNSQFSLLSSQLIRMT